MKPLLTILTAAFIILAGCATGPKLTLDQIQTKRTFALSKAKVFEAVRFFSIREGFRLDSIEEETGRIIGHRVQTDRRGNASLTVIMNLRVYSTDAEHTEVNARFAFSDKTDALTKEEEGILVDCYVALYGVLESESE